MQTENRFFDDLAQVASGALHTLGGLRDEIESRVRERVERLANEMDLVTREEFDAVSAMAAKARESRRSAGVFEAEWPAKGAAGRPAVGEAAAAMRPPKPAPRPGRRRPQRDHDVERAEAFRRDL